MTTAYEAAAGVADPELKVVTVADLGILREVRVEEDGVVRVTITPTYSACPAMDAIRTDIARALGTAGHPEVEVHTVLSPPWSTDWITDEGRAKLAAAGTAPPPARGAVEPRGRALPLLAPAPSPACPQCGSADVEEISRFGATACKSLWRCRSCAEPFDHVKGL